MASPPMAKIVLKNTTKMSLNERFTAYRQQAQSAANTFRQKMQMQRQASIENRRLAQQMANRPTVIAALRLKKRSLQQRLGQKRNPLAAATAKTNNVKARLTLNARSNTSPIQGRLGGMRSYRGRNLSARRGVNRGGFVRPGTSPMIKARLGSITSFNYGTSFRQNQRGGFRGRRNFNRGGQQFRNNPRNQIRRGGGRMRGQTDGRRQGIRGRGGWNKGVKPLPTKQELDNQLDEYMAETKSTLDAQLTQYMSQGY